MHADLDARTLTTAGWEHVDDYGDVPAERRFLRDSVGIADITARAKVDLRGDIPPTLETTRDSLFARMADDWALVFEQPGAEKVLLPKLTASAGPGVMVSDVTDGYAGFALAGPSTTEVMSRLTPWDADQLRPGRSTAAQIALVRVIVFRHEVTPVLELYVETPLARYFFETLLSIAQRVGGGPVGWHALHEEGWR